MEAAYPFREFLELGFNLKTSLDQRLPAQVVAVRSLVPPTLSIEHEPVPIDEKPALTVGILHIALEPPHVTEDARDEALVLRVPHIDLVEEGVSRDDAARWTSEVDAPRTLEELLRFADRFQHYDNAEEGQTVRFLLRKSLLEHGHALPELERVQSKS